MSMSGLKFKSHFALRIKLKSLYFSCKEFSRIPTLKIKIYYEDEEENQISDIPERVQIIEIQNDEFNFMFKADISKNFYLPLVCLNEQCPEFINIICNNEKKKDIGLKLYLNKYYSFLKYYSSYKIYKVYEHNNSISGHIELAIDLVSCENPFDYFGKNKKYMEQKDYYTLATKVSVSKLKKEMLMYKTDKDVDMHIESFKIIRNDLKEIPLSNKQNLLNLFSSSSKNAYDKMPIPLIPSSSLFDVLLLEIFPQYRQNQEKPCWLKIVNDAYDLYLYNYFQCYNIDKENHMYAEIKMCSLFFYLESIFVKIAANFAKSVIIQEYTKYTSFRYVDKLFSKKSKLQHKTAFNHNFQYEKIVGNNPLEIFKLFKNDEIYITNDTDIIREGLIGILIFGDDKTDVHNAYKKYNSEIKAQQWINKGIAQVKVENLKELKKKLKHNIDNERISLSILSFNLSTIVSYKGFKMYIIPSPVFPLVITKLNDIEGNLKYELKLLEKVIPTYGLLKQNHCKNSFFVQYHYRNNYVFYNINPMMNKSNKNNFFFFENSKLEYYYNEERVNDFYSVKSFYSSFLKICNNINLYEDVNEYDEEKKNYDKKIDIHLQKVVKDIESLSFHVPFDSISLKTFLHSRGIRMKQLGRMLKFVTFKWLYNMIYNEILIRCIKNFIFYCIREICLFYKKNINNYLFNEFQKYGNKFKKQQSIFLNNLKSKNETYSFNENKEEEVEENIVSSSDESNEELKNSEMYESFSNGSRSSIRSAQIYLSKDNMKKVHISSNKKALKTFLNIAKILKKKMILENHLDCNFSLSSKLLNFHRFKKSTNTEMYSLKKLNNNKINFDNLKLIKKIYKGNITVVDMFIINVFNLILTNNHYTENILSVVKKLCAKLFNIQNFNSIELHHNYIYENLQKCLGILFFPSLLEYDEEIRKANKTFELHHLKLYSVRIKRSINIMYIDLPIYKYIQNPEHIDLDINNENKKILSHLIFFTIMYHHHLSMSNKIYTQQLLMHEKKNNRKKNKNRIKTDNENTKEENINVYNSYKKEYKKLKSLNKIFNSNDYDKFNEFLIKNEKSSNWPYDIKLNSLLSSKDSITLYNDSSYLTFYGLLDIIAIGIKFNFFESSLKISNYVFRYISEDNVISVHFRIMWLSMYAFKKYYSRYFSRKIELNDMRNKLLLNYFYTNQSYDSSDDNTSSEDPNEVYKEKFPDKKLNTTEMMIFKDNASQNSGSGEDLNEISYHKEYEKDTNYNSDYTDNDDDCFFHFRKIDVYKKTYQICSNILNNYFFYFHPFYLDFYLSLAWCNKSAKKYKEFLFLLRATILLQINMSLKSYNEDKIENIKLSDDFDSLVYSKIYSNRRNNSKNILEEGNTNESYFFLNDVCYPHEKLFLLNNIKLIPKSNSFYNIRLACTLHYFANSLFYYYNTNKIVKKYKNNDFVFNSSFYCVKVLESVKSIFQFFDTKNIYIAKVSLDLSLMILKIMFSKKGLKINKNKMMTYALINAKHAEEIFRYNFGVNNIDTLYCKYVLSLIYMHLDNKNCIYIFEEVYYYLMNYNYTYHDRNIVNEIFWYFPENIVTLKCINGKGILDKDKIKCHLFNIYINIFIPFKYLKKIMKILLLLYSNELYKNKKNVEVLKFSTDLCDANLYSYEKILVYIKTYKYILNKKDLFSQIHEYNELLKNNENIISSQFKNIKRKEKYSYAQNNHEVNFNFYDNYNVALESFIKNIHKYDSKNIDDIFLGNEKNLDFILENENNNLKKYKSVTAYYLKNLINKVEHKVKLLYNKEKYLFDASGYSNMKKNNIYFKMMKSIKLKKLNRNTHAYSLLKNKSKNIILDTSTIDTVSVFNSDESEPSDSSNSYNCNGSSLTPSTNRSKANKYSNNRKLSSKLFNLNNEKTLKGEKKLIFNDDIHIFMSILYYFLNYKTFERIYTQDRK